MLHKKKLDKDIVFTSRRNSWRVSEVIYSSKFDSSSNPNAVLRLTYDPINSSNAAQRSTHDLCQTVTNTLGIDTNPMMSLGCSNTTCCARERTSCG